MKTNRRLLLLLFSLFFTTVYSRGKIPQRETPTWGDIYRREADFISGWKYIVIHHSATAAGSAAAFHRYHTEKGYGGLAYHFVIGNGAGMKDGEIAEGFRWTQQCIGTHVSVKSWYHNIFGIGICLVGDFNSTSPTEKQLLSLTELCTRLCREYSITPEDILGHREVPQGTLHWDSTGIRADLKEGSYEATSCPGKQFPRDQLRVKVHTSLSACPVQAE